MHIDDDGDFLHACISDPQRGTLTRERSQIHRIGSEDRPRDFRLFGLANDEMIVQRIESLTINNNYYLTVRARPKLS